MYLLELLQADRLTVSSNKHNQQCVVDIQTASNFVFHIFFLYSIFCSFVVVVIPNPFSSELIELYTSEG